MKEEVTGDNYILVVALRVANRQEITTAAFDFMFDLFSDQVVLPTCSVALQD